MLNIHAELNANRPGRQSGGERRSLVRSRRNRLQALRKEHLALMTEFARKFGRPPEELTTEESAQIERAIAKLIAKWG